MEQTLKNIKNFVKHLKEGSPDNVTISEIDRFISEQTKGIKKGEEREAVINIQNHVITLHLFAQTNEAIERIDSFIQSQIEGSI